MEWKRNSASNAKQTSQGFLQSKRAHPSGIFFSLWELPALHKWNGILQYAPLTRSGVEFFARHSLRCARVIWRQFLLRFFVTVDAHFLCLCLLARRCPHDGWATVLKSANRNQWSHKHTCSIHHAMCCINAIAMVHADSRRGLAYSLKLNLLLTFV